MTFTIREGATWCGWIFSVLQAGIILILLTQSEHASTLHLTISIVGLIAGILVARHIRIGHVLYSMSLLLQLPLIVTYTLLGYGGIFISMVGGRVGSALKLFLMMVLGCTVSLFYLGSLVVVVWDLTQNELLAKEWETSTDANPDREMTDPGS